MVGECGTGVDSSARDRLEGEARGIPHFAKNERDVGHPAIGAGIDLQKRVRFTLNLLPDPT